MSVDPDQQFNGETLYPVPEIQQFDSVEECLEKLPPEEHEFVNRVLYGPGVFPMEVSQTAQESAKQSGLEIAAYGFRSKTEQLRSPRIVRVACLQHKMPAPTNAPVQQQKDAVFELAREAIATAAESGVNIFCFQEFWYLPYGIATREKLPWTEFPENAETGSTTRFLQEQAKKYNMVIVSPILERDENHSDLIWDTAVIIDNHGDYLGKHRKNHIPRVFYYNESRYYMEGNTGHPVFETEFGKIAVNICFGHHHNLNWLMFGLNGAEIVFNPSACNDWHEHIWPVLARNAAAVNGYFTVAVNRPGIEVYEHEFTAGDGRPAHNDVKWYGSSYIASPDGSRTPGLSRRKTGLLIAELNLNLCRQTKDLFAVPMTMRLDLYARSLSRVLDIDYIPQVIRKRVNRAPLNFNNPTLAYERAGVHYDRYGHHYDRANSS